MTVNLGVLVNGLGLIVGFSLLTLIFIVQEKRTGRKVYFLKEGLFMGALTGIASTMLAGPEVDPLSLGPELIDRIAIPLWIVVFSMVALFFMSLRSESPDWRVVAFLTGIGVASSISGFASLASPSPIGNLAVLAWNGGFACFSAIVFFYNSSVFLGAYRRIPERRSIVIGTTMVLISIAYLLSFLLGDLSSYLGTEVIPGFPLETALDLIRVGLLLIVALSLASDMEYCYRIPVRLFGIWVIASSGISAYHYGPTEEDTDPGLFASALTAISIVMKESGVHRGVNRVVTGERTVVVEERVELGFTVAVVVERVTMVIAKSVKTFADMFADRFGSIAGRNISSDDFPDSDMLVHVAFPFLRKRSDQ
ncbi:MAG: hypothetical protein HXY34_03590 [Candidatus Thorarchaeota archaeon]|nr:hypothetical protein [Candidatus Thorarchaeota archaeon]